jgi:WD40 repeat protein
MFSGSSDRTIKVWDLSELLCIKTLSGHNGAVTCLKISPDKKLVSGSWDNSIKIWDLKKMQCENSLRFDGFFTDYIDFFTNSNLISFHQSRRHVFLKIWSIDEGSCLKTIKLTGAVKVKLLTDHLILIVFENKDKKDAENDDVYYYEIWSIQDEVSLKSFKGYKYPGSFYGMELLPNGNLVFCTDQLIKIVQI